MILVCNFCIAQKAQNIGIGVVIIKVENKPILSFYDFPESETVLKQLQFTYSESKADVYNMRTALNLKWFEPEVGYVFDEYGNVSELGFRCIEKKNSWFHVIINNSSDSSLWIPADSNTTFQSWNNFLKNTLYIKLAVPDQFVYQRINGHPDTINFNNNDCLHVIKVTSSWLKVKRFTNCDSLVSFSNSFGWVKWHDDRGVIINYYNY